MRWVGPRASRVRSMNCSDMRMPPSPSVMRVVHLLEERRPARRAGRRRSGTPTAGGCGRTGPAANGPARSNSWRSGCRARAGRRARTWRSMSKSGSSRHSGGARRPSAGTTRWRRRGTTWPAVRACRRAEPVEVGRPIEQRDVAEAAREVRVLLDVPHDGLDVRHAALVVHGAVCHRPSGYVAARRHRANVRRPAGPAGPEVSAGCEVCLNSLSSGQPVEQVDDALDRAPGELGVAAGRSMRRTNAAWSPTMNVGTPQTSWLGRRRPRAPCARSRAAAPVAISANTASASTPAPSRTRAHDRLVADAGAVDVAGGEEGRGARRGTRRGTGRAPRRRPAGRAGRCRRRASPRCRRSPSSTCT